MMNKPPLFLAAFANNARDWLPRLSQEEANVRNALDPLDNNHQMEYLSLGSVSTDDIYKNFNRYFGRIRVFHFGGHSGSTLLQLVDKNHRAASLATLMGMEKDLRLVVLNGCSNKDQVKGLLDAGVKAVIATSVPIEDTRAAIFAKQFYEAMVNGKTIKEAYTTAITYLNDQDPNVQEAIELRGPRPDGQELDYVPWGLYYREEGAQDWKFPKETIMPGKTESIKNDANISGNGNINIQNVSNGQINIQF